MPPLKKLTIKTNNPAVDDTENDKKRESETYSSGQRKQLFRTQRVINFITASIILHVMTLNSLGFLCQLFQKLSFI